MEEEVMRRISVRSLGFTRWWSRKMLSKKKCFFSFVTGTFILVVLVTNHHSWMRNVKGDFLVEFGLNKRNISRFFDLTPMLDDPETLRNTLGEQFVFLLTVNGTSKLQQRYVCCLESLVKLNPETSIVILTTDEHENFGLRGNAVFEELLQNGRNLFVASVNISEVVKNTILEKFVGENFKTDVLSVPAQLSDFLRLCLLWKLGGAYIDFDVLIIKNLTPILKLKNFLTCDDIDNINNAFVGFQRHHPFLLKVMETTRRKFDYNLYSSGVTCLNIAFNETFDITVQEAVEQRFVNELVYVLDYMTVTPARYWQYNVLYDNCTKEDCTNGFWFYEQIINVTYGYHLWNSFAGREAQSINSSSPFLGAARKFCPRSIANSDGTI